MTFFTFGNGYTPQTSKPTIYNSFEEMLIYLNKAGEGIDICELCGGEARPSTLAIRRKLNTGQNFDLATNVDLGNKKDQEMVLDYIAHNQVLVVVMGPSCRSVGPTSNLNQSLNHDTWKRHRDEDMPHLCFCAAVALLHTSKWSI